MIWLLYVYLGGVVLFAYLQHGMLGNPTLRDTSARACFRACLLWPINMFIP